MKPQTLFSATLVGPLTGVRFGDQAHTITIENASVGFRVRDITDGLSGYDRYWHPTYRGACERVYRLAGQLIIERGYVVKMGEEK